MARVESKTWISTKEKYDSVAHVRPKVKGILGQWMSPDDMKKEIGDRFPGCMAGQDSPAISGLVLNTAR